MDEIVRLTRPAWGVAAVLLVAVLGVWLAPPLPPNFSGLRTAGPYAVLITALGVSWWFNRGRSFAVLASILLGWSMYHAFPQRVVFTAIAILVPLNCFLAFVARERGARYGMALRWFVLVGLEAVFLVWISERPGLEELLSHWALRSPPTPLAARIAFAAAMAAAVWRAYPEFRPLQIANGAALGAFFIGTEWGGDFGVFAAFMTAAGALQLVALLQESHRLAFRDELTGLPGRRALEERLRSLGGRYAIAMVDVDHFKEFNDTHGHDVGDQVLKLVAARLLEVGGGGEAYRYGGEEFSLVFPELDARRAVRHLESLRRSIEHYRMAVRGPDRPKKPDEAQKLRGKGATVQKTLSVTVSIGVADPGKNRRTAQQVLKAADEALYRAKQGGRNRVAR